MTGNIEQILDKLERAKMILISAESDIESSCNAATIAKIGTIIGKLEALENNLYRKGE